ncbi:MAG TPA: DUF4012 domain-containing protein [Sporichthyaceae bacterium]|jgi:hypothetical protein
MNQGSADPARAGIRRRLRRRWLLIACPTLTVLAIGWLGVTALLARADLTHARGDLVAMRSGVHSADLSDTQPRAADLRSRLGRAHLLTRGPIWSGMAAIPVVGDPFRSVRGMTAALNIVGDDAVPALVTAADQLDPKTLRDAQGRIAVDRVSTAAPNLARAGTALDDALAEISALPRHTWLSSVDSARDLLLRQLSPAAGDLRAAQQAADLVPALLGENKSYLLTFQNNAEARGTGGMPGAFALARVHDGRITLDRFAGEGSLSGVTADVRFGPDYNGLYPQQVTQRIYQDANLSPHFPYGAAILTSLWQQRFGEKVDGVIALDPVVLGYLLRATGPVPLPDGSTVTADNIVALTEQQAYVRYPGPPNNGRRDYLAQIEQVVSSRIMSSEANPGELIRGLRRAIDERRLLVWSADTALQRRLEQTSVSGALPITRAPFVGVSIVNEAGNKLDYYLDRAIRWQRAGCGAQRSVTVSITLTNNAPAGLPAYVTNRSDPHSYPVRPGDNRLTVSYFATNGALMNTVTLDGKPWVAGIGTQRSHPVFVVDVELPRGSTRTVVLHLTEPAGDHLAPMVLNQPLVRPAAIRLDDARCP